MISMDTDMADDDKAAKADGSDPVVPFDAVRAGESSPAGSSPKSSTPASSDLWTVSDTRGPLGTAGEEPGVVSARDEPAASQRSTERPAPEEPAVSDPVADHPLAGGPASDPKAGAVTEQPKSRSLLPIAASLVIGALIGAGSAALVYSAAESPLPTPSDPQIAGLPSRVDTLEHRPDSQAAVAALKGDLANLDAKVSALQARADTRTAPATDSAPPAVDLSPLQDKIAALQAAVDAIKAQSAGTQALAAKVSALDSDVAGAKKDTSSAQAGIADVAGAQKLLAAKVMVPALAVVADSLVQQIDQGQPYVAQVDALVALGADPAKIAILRQNAGQGVPSAKTLAAKFEPLVEQVEATAHKAPPSAGFVDRLKSGMFSMVSVRSADDTSGTDLPSRVAHIRAELAHDDVAGALATWDALPAEAKIKGDAWSALAKTSAEAMDAARALQHDAIVALGAKKS